MRCLPWLVPSIAALFALSTLPTQAVRLADGQVYFVQPPQLVATTATQTQIFAWGSTYYFTLTLPETAGEPLQRVEIAQRDGNVAVRRVNYDLEDTVAFIGTRRDRSTALTLGETTYNPDTQTIAVTFDPPISPGTTFTLGLRPNRNPQAGGVYLFGVTAFPAGDRPYGQFLGYGRLHFDEPDYFFFH